MINLKKILILLYFLILISSPCYADLVNPLNVRESDGSPDTYPYQIKVPNGTLTDGLDGTITLNYAGSPSGGVFTAGSIPFGDGTASLAQNNANFFWDNINNRLGIGTTSPADILHVATTTTGNTAMYIQNAGASNNQAVVFGRKSQGTVASPTALLTGDGLLVMQGQGYDGTSWIGSGAIAFRADGTIGTNRVPSHIEFYTGTDAAPSVNTERMRITNAGFVGVGTTSPGAQLHAVAGAAATKGLIVQGAASQTANLQEWQNSSGTVLDGIYADGAIEVGATGTTPGKFRLSKKGGTATATTDWALTGGWGANATISAVSGNDSRGTVTVTTSALDSPLLNPTITLTFKDGTFTTAPFAVACMDNNSTTTLLRAASTNTTATTLAIVYDGTPAPTTSATYRFSYFVEG